MDENDEKENENIVPKIIISKGLTFYIKTHLAQHRNIINTVINYCNLFCFKKWLNSICSFILNNWFVL